MGNEFLEGNDNYNEILSVVLKVPGVKVDREKFLRDALGQFVKDSSIIDLAISKNTVEAGIAPNTLNKISRNIIRKRTTQTTVASFAAGIPGGLAMAATIPADAIQFFAVTIRLAQELAYIYGYDDLWKSNDIDEEKVNGELTIFLGVMFGVGGSASALRILSSALSKQVIKKLPQKPLTKTIYYPIIKKIAAIIGIKVTKGSFAKGISKVIPILGGVVSGGLTYASMKPMASRLNKVLNEVITNYTDKDLEEDLEVVGSSIIDVGYENLSEDIDIDMDTDENTIEEVKEEVKITKEPVKSFSIADELLKYKELLDAELITREEFDLKKDEIMNK